MTQRATQLWGSTGTKSLQLSWGYVPPSTIQARQWDSTTTMTAIAAASTTTALSTAIGSFQSAYGLSVTYATSSGTSGSIAWQPLPSDIVPVQTITRFIVDEYTKFPAAFVNATILDNIILTGKLTYAGQAVGGLAVGNTYYMEVPNAVGDEGWYRGTIQHEFFHVINNTWTADFAAIDSAWTALNPSGFTYGSSAAAASFSGDHPTAFDDYYSRTSLQEDRANVFSYQMARDRYLKHRTWVQSDSALKQKSSLLNGVLNSKNAIFGTDFYDAVNATAETVYTLKRGSTVVYSGTSLAFNDEEAIPGQTYTYTVTTTSPDGAADSNVVNLSLPGDTPAPSGTIALDDYQFEIDGLVLGADTPFRVENFEGMGWETRGEDVNRPLQDGDYTGPFFVSSKTRTITLRILGGNPDATNALRQALARAWYIDAKDPMARKPLRWKLPGQYTSWVNGRPGRASFTVDQLKYGLIVATLEYKQNDPFEYDDVSQSITLALNQDALAGFTFPMEFPITFASSSASTSALAVAHPATNLGMVPTSPTMRITGPIINPRVDNQTTGEFIAFNITMPYGQWLDVDFDQRTVLLNGTASRYNVLRRGSSWWKLQPGDNDISFSAMSPPDGRTLMTLTWRNARL